jgi:hypothetical protein
MPPTAQYTAKLDSKRRLVIRDSAPYEQYLVRHLDNGVIELRPQVTVDVASISENTLRMIEASMENLKRGVVSPPVDLDEVFPDL